MRAVQLLLLAGSILHAGCDPACELSPRVLPTAAPLRRVEMIGGDYARVELASGVTARSLVGAERFAGLEPGWTPDVAAAHFGKPSEVVTRNDDETLFVYERQGKRAAVVRQRVVPSGGGPMGTSFHLEAVPSEGFVETLPEPVRDLIRSQPQLRRIDLVSDVPNDWNIEIHVRDGHVDRVSAHAAPPPEILKERDASRPAKHGQGR